MLLAALHHSLVVDILYNYWKAVEYSSLRHVTEQLPLTDTITFPLTPSIDFLFYRPHILHYI